MMRGPQKLVAVKEGVEGRERPVRLDSTGVGLYPVCHEEFLRFSSRRKTSSSLDFGNRASGNVGNGMEGNEASSLRKQHLPPENHLGRPHREAGQAGASPRICSRRTVAMKTERSPGIVKG